MKLYSLPFDYLFVASPQKLAAERDRIVLADSLFVSPISLAATNIVRALCLISHKIQAVKSDDHIQRDLLLLSSTIMQRARTVISPAALAVVKEFLFGRSTVFRSLCFSQALGTVISNGLFVHLHQAISLTLNI